MRTPAALFCVSKLALKGSQAPFVKQTTCFQTLMEGQSTLTVHVTSAELTVGGAGQMASGGQILFPVAVARSVTEGQSAAVTVKGP
jgi:hypothetical protein